MFQDNKIFNKTIILITIGLGLSVPSSISECMTRSAVKAAKEANRQIDGTTSTIKRTATTTVNNSNAMTTTHEHSQVSPINKIGGQHPSYVRNVCDQDNCKTQMCEKACGPIIERAHVGHGTHNGEFAKAVFLAPTDLDGDPKRPQYGVFYDVHVPNTDTIGDTINQEKTSQMHSDKTHTSNVHMNSTYKDSNKKNIVNPDNINDENIN